MSDPSRLSIRISFTKPKPSADKALAQAAVLAKPNETLRNALTLGMQEIALKAQKERFTGKGPFPVSQHRLGNVSGRLKRDIHAEDATITATGYSARIGSVVEYFGIHELGFEGSVSVRAHTRKPHTIAKRNMSRLEQSVRSHSRQVKVPARAPLRHAIEDHALPILDNAISRALRKLVV